jgi:sigma-B regulation protein RsbU (phosphoserine phosphatase)
MTHTECEPQTAAQGSDDVRAQRAILANLRHELRTPLNAIIGYSEMLIEDAQDLDEEDDQADLVPNLKKVHAAGNQLLTLVNDVLDPAGIETGQLEVDLEAFGAQLCYELRTPLNAVFGYSEMLLEDAEDEGPKDFIPDLQKIHAAAQHFLSLIIEFSKIQAGEIDADIETLTASSGTSSMIQDVVSTIRPLAEDAASTEAAEGGSLLVVDDNETNRDLLARRLERQGHAVALAEDGRQALEMVKTHSFDLVLLDIRMPEMDGYEVCEHLKADEGTRDIPIIFISALGEIQDKIQAFTVGGVDYVTKPFQFKEVLARVETHLTLRKLQKQLQDANEKMAQELALAGEVQTSFLPRALPDIPGWQLSVALKPARETSGDFYDVNLLPNGRLGILVADVVDKGVGAALYMALSWTLLRTYATEYPAQPELVLSTANHRILMDTKVNRFATVFYGILDLATGALVYCNAGHCPPYLISAQNSEDVRELTRTGVPLGMFEDEAWEQGVVQLAPSDVLVLYTDGITEARNEHGEFFDEDRLLASVRANLGHPAQAIQDAIIRAVYEFMGDVPQSDDIALAVVIRDSVVPVDD